MLVHGTNTHSPFGIVVAMVTFGGVPEATNDVAIVSSSSNNFVMPARKLTSSLSNSNLVPFWMLFKLSETTQTMLETR